MKDYQKALDTLNRHSVALSVEERKDCVGSLQELVDGRKPMKPNPNGVQMKPSLCILGHDSGVVRYVCPKCHNIEYVSYEDGEIKPCCPDCGQHIDWEGKK